MNTGLKLIRVPDWDVSGPYWLVSLFNGFIAKSCMTTTMAVQHLRNQGLQEFEIDKLLYDAELWALRLGRNIPVHRIDHIEEREHIVFEGVEHDY